MTRSYTLKRRAEQQAETRRKITEAALDLHGSVGPAFTTVTQIAEQAGVQRRTFYAHFPDERSLFLACSGLGMERSPPPDVEDWRNLPAGRERIGKGLDALYLWYERNAGLLACVLRDAEHHDLTREIAGLRFGPVMAGYREVLGNGLDARRHALLAVALNFSTWRTLTSEGGLDSAAAAETMTEAVMATAAAYAE